LSEAQKIPQEDADFAVAKLAMERGLVTVEQIVDAEAELSRLGGKASLGDLLVELGHLAAKALASLREELGHAPPGPGPADPDPFPPDRHFGKYQLVREVGRGAMGVVYQAIDAALGRNVALKVMRHRPAADPKVAAVEESQFAREAQLPARLDKHPNLVTVYEAGAHEGRRFIAMEFIEGRPMSDWRVEAGPPLRTEVRLLRDVALAVHHAHEGGILHRDLKPRNVLVDAKGRACVSDFGMAKALGGDYHGSSTSAGTVVGTPSYMSPEQAQGLRTLDRRADVYALGAMLYEVLTGRPPFPGDASIVALMKVVQEPVVPPSRASASWAASTEDKSIEAVCMRALAKKPDDRYATARDFADALSAWLGERPAAKAASAPLPLAWILVAAGIAVAALAGLALLRSPGVTSPPPPSLGIDLLPLVDPARDGVSGTWKVERGRLSCGTAPQSRIEIPYRPPEEYDLRVTFVRLEGTGEVDVVLSQGGRAFLWSMGAQADRFFGFAEIGGLQAHENDSSVRRTRCLENGRPHELVLHVRKDAVRAWLDGILITEAKREGLDLQGERRPRDPGLLGLAAGSSPAEFRRVEILEVSGRGRPAR
jgi:predicted Ser/Thr protein kinase